jgi:hypothetical protein
MCLLVPLIMSAESRRRKQRQSSLLTKHYELDTVVNNKKISRYEEQK